MEIENFPFRKRLGIYAGTFLIAFTTLIIEITFSRLLSVITFYHLAFFAVSTAMLGMTAGAVYVYLKPAFFRGNELFVNLSKTTILFALSVPVSVIMLCIVPLSNDMSIMKLFALFLVTVACSLPFFFSGIILSVILTKIPLPTGKLYAADLIGASLGCIFVLFGLEIFDAPSLIILSGALAIPAVFMFTLNIEDKLKYLSIFIFILIFTLSVVNFYTVEGIRPLIVKDRLEEPLRFEFEKWNSFSRVVMYHGGVGMPQYWGASPVAPPDSAFTHAMNIDGEAGSVMNRFSSLEDIDYLKYDITNAVYYLRPEGGACIIGVGGGRDLQSALLFGHKEVLGVELNPVFVNLLKGPFKDFAGLWGKEGVRIVNDEARNYLTINEEKFSVIQMSLIDTWASTGAGAFSLSENSLYTVEAWKVFFNRLNDDGIFTVSRWYSNENLGETGRAVSLAASALMQSGIQQPSSHIMMLTVGNISTLLISKSPFPINDVNTIEAVAEKMEFNLIIKPGVEPPNHILSKIISSGSVDELISIVKDEPLNYTPPTDENPYFFNMLKLAYLNKVGSLSYGVIGGNLRASVTLVLLIICLMLLAFLTIIVPLIYRKRSEQKVPKKLFWSGALYFALIGSGFMLVEIALIQKLSVYLGHPVYALGILLAVIIMSSGLGSLFSVKLQIKNIYILPIIAGAAIIAVRFLVTLIISSTINSEMAAKIAISIAFIFPLGFILGMFFPSGMKLAKTAGIEDVPWYWALNGVFGVTFSALAVFISIYAGISYNFYAGALCYLLLLLFIRTMQKYIPSFS